MARTMKDSGIDLIGMIPVYWNIKKAKYIASSFQKGNGITKEEIFLDGDIQCVRYGEIYSKYEQQFTNTVSLTKLKEISSPRYIYHGDILFAGTGELVEEIGKNIVFLGSEPCLAGGDIIIMKHSQNPIFMNYALNSIYSQQQKSRGKAKLKVVHISATDIGNILIALPPINEQEKIADFLDEKVSEIDNIISKTKESIEHYKKYKQAVITEIALGGLNKAVTTKNSGIDWIGNIPEHWKITPFKFVMTERNEKNIPVKTDERLALSIDKGITTYAEKTTNLDRFKDDVTQYKLAYEGDLVFNSMNMIVGAIGYSNYFGCVSPAYYTYYDNVEGHYTSKYYEYIFRSKTMRKVLFSLGKGIMAIDRGGDKINTCRLKVSRDDLRCLKVPVPTEQEQQEIVKYLDAKCAEIDALIAKKEAFVEEMETYKKSLIYEYVTGKKEVL